MWELGYGCQLVLWQFLCQHRSLLQELQELCHMYHQSYFNVSSAIATSKHFISCYLRGPGVAVYQQVVGRKTVSVYFVQKNLSHEVWLVVGIVGKKRDPGSRDFFGQN